MSPLQSIMNTGLWRIGKGFYGQMRPKSIGLGQMGRFISGKKGENHYLTEQHHLLVKHGGGKNLMVWGCMGWNGVGKLIEIQGHMDKVQYCEVLVDGVQESFEKLEMVVVSGTFSMIMTPNTCL